MVALKLNLLLQKLGNLCFRGGGNTYALLVAVVTHIVRTMGPRSEGGPAGRIINELVFLRPNGAKAGG